MSESVNKNKYKTIYADIMPVYRESEDYCRMTLDMLKHAIAEMDTDATRGAYDKLTICFNDLTKTVEEISIRFREVSELLDDCLDDNRQPNIDKEGYTVYCVGGGLLLDPLEVRHWVSEALPHASVRRAWYHVPYNLTLRRGILVCELNGEHGSTYRMALFRCYPMLDFDDGEYSLNSVIRRLASRGMGYGANTISRRLRKERENEGQSA